MCSRWGWGGQETDGKKLKTDATTSRDKQHRALKRGKGQHDFEKVGLKHVYRLRRRATEKE